MRKTKPPIQLPAEQIKTFRYGKLEGRIAHFKYSGKSKSSETFVVISGHHTSHERMASFAQFLAGYGEVYAIDVPGFGGMGSFDRINKPIDLDSYAEYLYTILKTHKLNKNTSIFAVSLGGQIVTRMLQRYPESQSWLRRVVGFVTFAAGKDMHLSLPYKLAIQIPARIGSTKLGAKMIDVFVFNPVVLRGMLRIFSLFKKKMKASTAEFRKKSLQMEYFLWRVNDSRTQAKTTLMMLFGDLRRYSEELIDVEMHNILTKHDQYVDEKEVNKTFRDLYRSYTPHYLELDVHMPSMIADKSEVAAMFDRQMIDAIMNPKES